MTHIDTDVCSLIDDKIAELKSHGYVILRSLPECTEEMHILIKRTVTLIVWKDTFAKGTLRIVVQVSRRSEFPGLVGLTQADGFRITADGDIQSLLADDLYEFG